MTFEELVEAPELRRAIADLGWTEPTPIQKLAIPLATSGRDVVGIAQTGTGKTAAFLLPALQRQMGGRGLRTLVLCPTRELAQQVESDANELCRHVKLSTAVIVGGMKYGPQLQALKDGVDILVATPGRLFDHIEKGNVDLSHIETLVLDEADRMLDMGFRPQIDAILRHVARNRQTMLFSATMPNGVHAMALRIMKDPETVSVAPQGSTAANVEQKVYSVRPERKADLLVSLLEEKHWDQVLVFTARKSGADVLVARLKHADVSVTVLHGDREMKERTHALRQFAEGDVRVLVATDIAQRGLDIEGISHVVNYDVPRNPEDYVHRIGRTGRAGRSGIAVTFVSAGELVALRDIEKLLGKALPREAKPEFDYAVTPDAPKRPVARVNRTGGRYGSRNVDELTPEELQKLLGVS
ncbi:MAG TPA: DEAD/DEAH box helicase [Longimicrobiales bacterium]|nr:DEAD/DEAH box helicase [Longimicrobiales bacterium]